MQPGVEALEDRTVPSILFNNATTTTISDEGGPVLDNVHVELIFWGSGWNTGPVVLGEEPLFEKAPPADKKSA